MILWAILTAVYELYMLNVKYWRIFLWRHFSARSSFIVSFDRAYKEMSTKKYWKFSIAQFLWYDYTFKKQCTVTGDLDIWPMKVNVFSVNRLINNDPISVLYEFWIDISTNSWEIKYQNMGIGLLHVKRRTHQKWC